MKKSTLDTYLVLPIKRFIEKKTSVGLVLIFSAILAMIIANSPIAEDYHDLWKQHIHIGLNEFEVSKNLLHWINDGLMSMFFFLIGLELKREIMHGELSTTKKAMLPVVAAVGGMIFPAFIYLSFNIGTVAINGWGIPMATDIAFALGILYLLGDKIPFSLKVLLTAIAIVDDIGAVLVIAIFYTSEISLFNLFLGAIFLIILFTANYIGIRNTLFYAVIGIGGLWFTVLLSGVHATIAAVLAAFAIPTNKRVDTPVFLRKVNFLSREINKQIKFRDKISSLEEDEINNKVEKFALLTKEATPPLHRLERSLFPFVSFVILPIFAVANAGVTINLDSIGFFQNNVLLGVLLGLIVGKFMGIVLFIRLMVFLKFSKLPTGVSWAHVYGLGILAAIGFTMSFFITELAFENEKYLISAKVGILFASVISGTIGYFYLKNLKKIKNWTNGKRNPKKIGKWGIPNRDL